MIEKGTEYKIPFQVTEEIYDGFIKIFRDKNPLHTDDNFAKEKGFTSKVMQGNILNGFLSYFIGECLPLKNVIIFSQEIKYSLPVYLNDNLELIAVVEDWFQSVKMVVFKFHFLNQHNKKIAKGKISIGII